MRLNYLKTILISLILIMVIIGCSAIESGFYIQKAELSKQVLKVGEDASLTVEIAKKTGRQQIQHTARMEVKVISSSEDIVVIPTPTTSAEEVKNNNTLSVVARAGGVLPRPFKFKIKVKGSCKPGEYFLTIKATINKQEDTKIINFKIEGG
ncbi:MAG: hypothetical protein DRP09_19535 [Candidatus Thorarchaeota archaeon]|nr:MAG: hypothetical protein DRP09_19535 [Candidatus Thorarchaeota archaeon]